MFLALSAPLLPRSVLLVYDGEKEQSEAFKSACYIRNLLDHFSVEEKRLLQVSEYSAGMALDRDFIFIVFEEGQPESAPRLLDDLSKTKGTIVWINMHIERLLDLSGGKWKLRYDGWQERNDWRVFYRGEDFPKEDPGLNVLFLEDGANGEVHAEIEDGEGRRYPYAVRCGNLWYFADSPFSYALEGGRFLVLADLLHEILGENHPPEKKALVRIEDVNPEDDPADLRDIASYLSKEGVPFQVSLIPIYKIPARQYEVDLSDRPELVAALKDMVRKGGTIVLHGSTHQHRGATGEDYEFWDDIAGVPIPHESPDWVDERLKAALNECFRNGLYPLSWETPHYSASRSDYRTFARYFDTFYDRVMAAEISGTQQIFPYSLKLQDYGVTVIPENLGFLDFDNPEPGRLLENAKNMKVVRDGTASFFFHPFIPLRHLKTVVEGMKRQGWNFVSLRDFPCNVRTDSVWVTSSGGEGRIVLANQYERRFLIDRPGKIEKTRISPDRRREVVSENITLSPGSMYVLEALDSLPEAGGKSLWRKAGAFAWRLFPKKERERILTLSRSLVLLDREAGREDEFDQASFRSVLRVLGFNPEVRDVSRFASLPLSNYDLIVVPNAAARRLQDFDIRALLGFVETGGNLITDGMSNLARSLGFRFSDKSVAVSEIKELSVPAKNLFWNPPQDVFAPRAEGAVVLAKDAHSDTPLALVRPVKNGKVLFLGVLFDPLTPFGMSRFAYLPLYLKNALGLPFNVRRNTLEFYFDPGFHQTTSWEKLVARWKSSGIRIIYLAAWHFYEKYAFDYPGFIDLCHSQGIAVYAWFEFPQVTPLFWQNHPEWREKTATGEDGLCHWRQQMNLFNPRARQEAGKFFRALLLSADWDGVNIAELNFDTNGGAADPAKFTPLNDDVRSEFKRREGFDPIELFSPASPHFWKANRKAFDAFLRFRSEIVKDLHVYFLNMMETIKREKGKDMEVIVTAMDSLVHPEIVEECGVNMMDLLDLMKTYSFTLQVEDPARSWAGPPSRYLDYFEVYKKYIPDARRLMFDINCTDTRDILSRSLPSPLATGVELATTLFYATFPSGRAGIYSENTVQPFDLDILPFVTGSDVEIRENGGSYRIRFREPFVLTLDARNCIPHLNGKEWPFYGTQGVSIPSGESVLTFKKNGVLDIEALAYRMMIEGDVRKLTREEDVFRLNYNSPVPVSLGFSRPLAELKLDSNLLFLPPDRSEVVLPRGNHSLEIRTESGPTRIVDVVGYFSSSAFYLVGLLSMSLLLGMYLYVRIKG